MSGGPGLRSFRLVLDLEHTQQGLVFLKTIRTKLEVLLHQRQDHLRILSSSDRFRVLIKHMENFATIELPLLSEADLIEQFTQNIFGSVHDPYLQV
jgi:hypothetical protein